MAFALTVGEDDFQRVAKAIGVGAQKAALTLQRQAKGDFSPEWLGSAPPDPSMNSVNPVLLSALLEGWAAEKQPIQRTIYNWTKVLEQFATFVGHNDAARMMPEDLVRRKAVLLEAGLRTKTIRDSKIAPLCAILQWGVDNRKIATTPPARVVIEVRGNVAERIRGFTDVETTLIVRQAARELDPVRRWIPLLCAYSGARIAEICQLRGEDIFQHDGLWCLKIVPEAGSLKTVGSERVVPLHAAVIEAGFLEFVAAQRAGPLFPGLAVDRFGARGATVSRRSAGATVWRSICSTLLRATTRRRSQIAMVSFRSSRSIGNSRKLRQ